MLEKIAFARYREQNTGRTRILPWNETDTYAFRSGPRDYHFVRISAVVIAATWRDAKHALEARENGDMQAQPCGAEQHFIETCMARGFTRVQAAIIFCVYHRLGIITRDAVGGRSTVVHTVFFASDVMTCALELALEILTDQD